MLDTKIYESLCKRVRGKEGRVRTRDALRDLCSELNGDPIEIRQALLALRDDGKVRYVVGVQGGPISGFITVIPPKTQTPTFIETWRAVLAESNVPETDKAALAPLASALEGFTPAQMVILLSGLVRLRENQTRHFGQQIFSVSAGYLMCSSKLLTTLDAKALKAFGIELDRFATRPPYVVIGGNVESPAAVVLIENPVPFEKALESDAASHYLFVCTFGFGLSAAANDFGNQLARIVEDGAAYVLNRSTGGVPSLREILAHPRIHFWGDLDIGGMNIFCRLAAKLPQIALSALYGPMVKAIEHESSRHPYVAAVGKEGQGRLNVQSAHPDVCELANRCKHFGVDQEIVTVDQIVQLAGKAY